MAQPKNKMLGIMEPPPLMQLSVDVLSKIYTEMVYDGNLKIINIHQSINQLSKVYIGVIYLIVDTRIHVL